MSDYVISCCSTADLTKEHFEKRNISYICFHYELNGKIEVVSRAALKTKENLSVLYTPGVAAPCLEIQKDITKLSLIHI